MEHGIAIVRQIKKEEEEEEDIDVLNDETFGDGAIEDDWETTHLAKVGVEDEEEGIPREDSGLHHDDAILTAVPILRSGSTANHTPKSAEELDSSFASMSLKNLWPSSPKQNSGIESIWSSPELPHPQQQATPTMGGVPPGLKVISVEELERDLTSSPPPPPPHPPSSSPSPLSSHKDLTPPPPPPLSSQPPPGLPLPMMFLPPHGRMPLPVHPMMSRGGGGGGGWMLPYPHGIPPHLLPNRPIQQTPNSGARPYPVPPPHSLIGAHPPPRYIVPPPPHPHHHRHQFPPRHSLPPHHHLHSRPEHPQQPPPHRRPQFPSHQREPSRRSELLNEMKTDGSGFMTQKEKEWVIKVQLLQLQGQDPENDDYYYLNYVKKKATRESAESANFSLALPQVSREEKNYQPLKFNQTLGKLSKSSLAAPRRMIDAPFHGSEVGGGGGGEGGGGGGVTEVTAKKRQILLIIEKLYGLVLSLEDFDRRAFVAPEQERKVILKRKEEVCCEIFELLRLRTQEKTGRSREEQIFQQMTSYRKGKRLLKRIIPILTDAHAQAVLLAILRNMLVLLKRDMTDQVLPDLVSAVRGVVNTCDLQFICRCAVILSALPTGSKSGPCSVVRVTSHEFGSAVLLCLVKRGNLLCNSPYKTNDLCQEWLAIVDQLHSSLSPHSSKLSPLSTTLLSTLSNARL